MNFTFKQLEAFLFSAKLQSFSAAAVKLHTTQSAISKRLAELEESLGGPLLHRTSHGLELAQAASCCRSRKRRSGSGSASSTTSASTRHCAAPSAWA